MATARKLTTEQVAERLNAKKTGDGWIAKCPAHNDRNPSLSVKEGGNGRTLLKCFAGCSFDDIVKAAGLEPSELSGNDTGSTSTRKPAAAKKPRGRPKSTVRQRFRFDKSVSDRFERIFEYTDEEGKALYRVCRDKKKRFLQCSHIEGLEWSWGLVQNQKMVLYEIQTLPDAIQRSEPIYIVEGEKDVHSLQKIGFTATCNAQGAGKWRPEYCDSLKGADVVILPDNDDPGRDHADLVASSLFQVARSTKIVKLPVKTKGADVTDWIADGGTAEALKMLAADTAKWAPSEGRQKLNLTLQDLNQWHAIVKIGGKACVLNEDWSPIFDRMDISFSTPRDFQIIYGNRTIWEPVFNENGERTHDKATPIGTAWLKWPDRRQYEGIEFAPGKNLGKKYYNLFRGFAVTPKKGFCDVFWDHTWQNICAGDIEKFNYLRKWMAHAIQNPAELPGVAIILQGRQGTGKNMFVDHFGALFGQHYLQVTSTEHLAGRFNAHLRDALILHANEAVWGGDKSKEGSLKALITDSRVTIEFKGKDALTFSNYKRLIISTNEKWPVPVSMDDRRFVLLGVADDRKEDIEYFGDLVKEMKSGGLEALMYDLTHEDLTDFDVRRPPASEGLFDLKMRGMDATEQFLFEYLDNADEGDPENPLDQGNWVQEVVKIEIYNKYLEWCNSRKKNYIVPIGVFCCDISRIIHGVETTRPRRVDGTRPRCFRFPTLAFCRAFFEKAMKSDSSIWDD